MNITNPPHGRLEDTAEQKAVALFLGAVARLALDEFDISVSFRKSDDVIYIRFQLEQHAIQNAVTLAMVHALQYPDIAARNIVREAVFKINAAQDEAKTDAPA